MTSKTRFLTAMRAGGIPDRVPCAPDFSNYIPCRLTGLPFWKIYFEEEVPLWRAYLAAADYFGTEAWTASTFCTPPLLYEDTRHESASETVYDSAHDAMVRTTRTKTAKGEMTERSLCGRADPPTPIEKPIKNLIEDFPKFKELMRLPIGVDTPYVETMRAECAKRDQAFGLCIGYPGFQSWMCFVEGGISPLAYAEVDTPEILQEWLDLNMFYGTRSMELLLSAKPDYILFGGSGTITLASPELAMKYAIPALAKWSAMAKAAGIPTMIHSCGKGRVLIDMLCDHTDVNCVNPLEIPPMGDVDLAEVKKTRGHQISLMGNLHTTDVMLRGTPDQVRDAARRAIDDAAAGGGFILSTGDQCPRDTPDANLFALVEAARTYGKY